MEIHTIVKVLGEDRAAVLLKINMLKHNTAC